MFLIGDRRNTKNYNSGDTIIIDANSKPQKANLDFMKLLQAVQIGCLYLGSIKFILI